MTTGTKIAIACVIAGVALSALAGEITGMAWSLAAGSWILAYDKQRQHADRLERVNEFLDDALYGKQFSEQRGYIPGGYEIDQRARDKYGPLLDRINESGGHKPISQGGIRPHLCVCGKPLEDHR